MNIEILRTDKFFHEVEVGDFFIEPGSGIPVMKISYNEGIRYMTAIGKKNGGSEDGMGIFAALPSNYSDKRQG